MHDRYRSVGISISAKGGAVCVCVLLKLTEKAVKKRNQTRECVHTVVLNIHPCPLGRDAGFLLPVHRHVYN